MSQDKNKSNKHIRKLKVLIRKTIRVLSAYQWLISILLGIFFLVIPIEEKQNIFENTNVALHAAELVKIGKTSIGDGG